MRGHSTIKDIEVFVMTTGKAQGREESGAEGCVPQEDWGGKGCRGRGGKKVTESWKSLLFQEMAEIGREQTRDHWPFPSLMLQQRARRAIPCSAPPAPRRPRSPCGTNSPSPAPCQPSGSRLACTPRSPGGELDWAQQDERSKGRCDCFTRTYQFSFNHSQRNKNGCQKHFQIPFSYQGENAHSNYSKNHRII